MLVIVPIWCNSAIQLSLFHTEAEYTFQLRKDIIPLRLQPKYQPDGWLGALAGNRLYFDFSMEEKFNASVGALIKELGERGRGMFSTIWISV